MNNEKPIEPWRSTCPVACTLDLLGDRWSLLIVRDMLLGTSKFHQFLASPCYTPGMDAEGDIDALSLWAGQSVGLLSEIKPAGDIVREIVAQAQSTLTKLAQ